MNDSRPCNNCGQIKKLEDFEPKKGGLYGRAAQCRACRKIYLADYRQRNAEQIAQRMSTYYQNTKEARRASARKYGEKNKALLKQKRRIWADSNPDKVKEIQKRYNQKNADKVRLRRKSYLERNAQKIATREKQYREKNRDLVLARQKSWRQRNPEAFKQYNNLRRARRLANKSYKVTTKEILKLLSKPCLYCGFKSEHIDHVLPLSRGGSHSIGNLVGACAQCNLSKLNKTVMEWRLLKLKTAL